MIIFNQLEGVKNLLQMRQILNGFVIFLAILSLESTTFIIKGILQAPSLYKGGSDSEILTTTDKGRFATGKLLLIKVGIIVYQLIIKTK